MSEKNTVVQYIQFSKKVTKWGMILASFTLLSCLAAISIFKLSTEVANIIGKIYGSYITIMGITIGAYQGNSSIEKWTKAKYNYSEVTKSDSSESKET